MPSGPLRILLPRIRFPNLGNGGRPRERGSCLGNTPRAVILISDNAGTVRYECNACGAQQTMRRFVSRPLTGRTRDEPERGQWLQCRICGDWSPLEVRPPVTA